MYRVRVSRATVLWEVKYRYFPRSRLCSPLTSWLVETRLTVAFTSATANNLRLLATGEKSPF